MPARYRADHVGSLLRPADLLQARSAGATDSERLREIEDAHIRRVLARQEEIGFEIFTDGELRRRNFMSDFTDAVEGFDMGDAVARPWQAGGARQIAVSSVAGVVTGPLRRVRPLTGHELPFLKARAGAPFKITLPAPSNFLVTSYKPGVTDRAYPTRGDLLRDLVAVVRDEIEWLVGEGVAYVQLDAPYYSHYLDARVRERMREAGVDPDRTLDEAIAADNATVAGFRRSGVTLALHVCRGNNRSRWYTEGSYDAVADRLFGRLEVDAFLLEYDGARSGGFEPLRAVPRGKRVVLGLVTTKEPRLESPDELRRRIDEAARYVPLEDLALSPQCGFASVAAGNLLSMDDQWRKLALVVETATLVWGAV
jgi:5-methyltetrahydropteroyltriglutamate--homocysteine methyltransferase